MGYHCHCRAPLLPQHPPALSSSLYRVVRSRPSRNVPLRLTRSAQGRLVCRLQISRPGWTDFQWEHRRTGASRHQRCSAQRHVALRVRPAQLRLRARSGRWLALWTTILERISTLGNTVFNKDDIIRSGQEQLMRTKLNQASSNDQNIHFDQNVITREKVDPRKSGSAKRCCGGLRHSVTSGAYQGGCASREAGSRDEGGFFRPAW
jgi:hypothetical protein